MDYSLLGQIGLYGIAIWGLVRLAIAAYEDAKIGLLLREKSEASLFNGNGGAKK